MKYKIIILLFQTFFIVSEGIFFPNEQQITYKYLATVQNLIENPKPYVSQYEIDTTIHIRRQGDATTFTLYKPRIKEGFGELNDILKNTDQFANYDAEHLKLPFVVHYFGNGTINYLEMDGDEPTWSINLKKGIASLFQLDSTNILSNHNENQMYSFSSHEQTLTGECPTIYHVDPDEEELKITKTFDECDDHWLTHTSSAGNYNHHDKPLRNFIKTSRQRMYETDYENNKVYITRIESNWKLLFYPLNDNGGTQSVSVKQMIMKQKKDVEIDGNNQPKNKKIHDLYDKSDGDMSSYLLHDGINESIKCNAIYVEKLLQEVAEYMKKIQLTFHEPNWDQINYFHNLIASLRKMDNDCLKTLTKHLMDTSKYNQAELYDLYMKVMPFIGTHSSTTYMQSVIKNQQIDDDLAEMYYKEMPFHLLFPDEKLINELSDVLTWNRNNINEKVINAAILAFTTTLSKTNIGNVDDFIRKLINSYNSCDSYQCQMVFISALRNTDSKKIIKLLEPMVMNKSENNTDIRNMAMWAIMTHHVKSPIKTQQIYWPILLNNNENLELRVNALKFLLHDMSTENLMKIDHLLKEEIQNKHLYNIFYSILHGLARCTSPSYKEYSQKAANFIKYVPKPAQRLYDASTNIYDYYDSKYNMGAVAKFSTVGNFYNQGEISMYFELFSYTSNIITNQESFYLKLHVNQYVRNALAKKLIKIDMINYMTIIKLFSEINEFKKDEIEDCRIEMITYKGSQVTAIKFYNTIESIQNDMTNFIRNQNHEASYAISNIVESIVAVQSDIGTPVVNYINAPGIHRVKSHFTLNDEMKFKMELHGWNLQTYGSKILNPLTNTWYGSRTNLQMDTRIPINIESTFIDEEFILKFIMKNDDYFDKGDFGIQLFLESQVYVNGKDVNKNNQYLPVRVKLDTVLHHQWNYYLEEMGITYNGGLFDCDRSDVPKSYYTDATKNILNMDIINNGDSQLFLVLLKAHHLWSHFTTMYNPIMCGIGVRGTKTLQDVTDITLTVNRHLRSIEFDEDDGSIISSTDLNLHFTYGLKNNDTIIKGWDANWDLNILGESFPEDNIAIKSIVNNKEDVNINVHTEIKKNNTITYDISIKSQLEPEPASIFVRAIRSKSNEQLTRENIYSECKNEESTHTYACLIARTAYLHEDYKIEYKNVKENWKHYIEDFSDYLINYYHDFYETLPQREQLKEGSLSISIVNNLNTADNNIIIDGPFKSHGYIGLPNKIIGITSGSVLESEKLLNYEIGKRFICEIKSTYYINQYNQHVGHRLTDKFSKFIEYDFPGAKFYVKKLNSGLFLEFEFGNNIFTVHGDVKALNATYNGEVMNFEKLNLEEDNGSIGHIEYRMLWTEDKSVFLISAPKVTEAVISYTDNQIIIYAERDNDAVGLCYEDKK